MSFTSLLHAIECRSKQMLLNCPGMVRQESHQVLRSTFRSQNFFRLLITLLHVHGKVVSQFALSSAGRACLRLEHSHVEPRGLDKLIGTRLFENVVVPRLVIKLTQIRQVRTTTSNDTLLRQKICDAKFYTAIPTSPCSFRIDGLPQLRDKRRLTARTRPVLSSPNIHI